MSLITVKDLAKSYGPDDIFSGVNLTVAQGARAAVVGPNGIGKTTLLRIITGIESPTQGEVFSAKGLRTGYLPQEASFVSVHSLWDECLSAFDALREQEAELSRLESEMSDRERAGEVLARYGHLQAEFEHAGGYTYPTRIRQVLTGLGFEPEEYNYPLNHLSGGQRTRALLARLLLVNPDLLILDEPTNHLDIGAVEWLESYLSQWEGAALIVSHDRYFLDRVANTIFEMSRAGIETYRGNYSAYLKQREERWDLRHQLFVTEKGRMEKELEYVRKNISGQRTLQAKGKLKRISRQIEAIEQLGLESALSKNWAEISDEADISAHTMGVDEAIRRVRALREPTNRPPHLSLHLRPESRSGNIILRTQALKVGYPNKLLFNTQDIELRRLETAALIGPNGAGKTTFLKTILGQHAPLAGEVVLGSSLQIGYFAQAHEDLNPERTLVQEIEAVAPEMLVAEIRKYLARFLFSGDDVYKKVAVLSGGERGRLALAKLALTNANLLLLDEPTNHLDIPSQEILQEVLADYDGTILLVSHDRYLIDALGTQIWEIDEDQGVLRVFQGTYSQYRVQKEAEREAEKAASNPARGPEDNRKPRNGGRPAQEERRRLARIKEIEEKISRLESELSSLASRLENPPADPGEVLKLGNEYVATQARLEQLMDEWASLHE